MKLAIDEKKRSDKETSSWRTHLSRGCALCFRPNRFLFVLSAILMLIALSIVSYHLWIPGKDITDGRHDLRKNGIWIQHGWLGDDQWFMRNKKKSQKAYLRNPENIRHLAQLLRKYHITDVFPHLSPTSAEGEIPSVDSRQTELFLKLFHGFRVLPWVGGVLGNQVQLSHPAWRRNFVSSIRSLLREHPMLSGIHINIEPIPSGNKDFLLLLDDVRAMLPKGKLLSVAAFPPPTILQPFPEVHWDEDYYRKVAKRADQMVVMMYDTAIPLQKPYEYLMSEWVPDILSWGRGSQILFGIPAYQDAGVGYHYPRVENIETAIHGIHAGLDYYKTLPSNYQGIAIYCEWEMTISKWETLEKYFCRDDSKRSPYIIDLSEK